MSGDTLAEIIRSSDIDLIGAARVADALDPSAAAQSQRLLPDVRSVIVLGMEIPAEVFPHLSYRQEVGDMALRELYHQTEQTIGGRLDWEAYKTVKKLHAAGYKALVLPAGGPYDPKHLKGALSYKHAAQAAGLGSIGWHSLLITPQYGPRVKLALILTDAEAEALAPHSPLECQRCGACLKACPAGAISQPTDGKSYQLDVHACNSFLGSVGLCAECMKACALMQIKKGD
jgi:epoxyqueuosine reductase